MAASFLCFSELVRESYCSLSNWCFWVVFSLWLQSLGGECSCSGKWLTKLELNISRGQPCPASVRSSTSCFYNHPDVVEEVKSHMVTSLCLKASFCCLWGFHVNSVAVKKLNAVIKVSRCTWFVSHSPQAQNNTKSSCTLLHDKVFLIVYLSD